MDGDDVNHDHGLLARLNSLKKSNVTLRISPSVLPLQESASPASKETPEDLLARFQTLHGRRVSSQDIKPLGSADDEAGPPSPTVEELLAELGPEDQYTVSSTELQEAEQLVAEARIALPNEATTLENQEGSSLSKPTNSDEQSTKVSEREADEEAKAASSLQDILDEVNLEKQLEDSRPKESQTEHSTHRDPSPSSAAPNLPQSFSSLVFPSTPDIPLSSLNLPSAPTTAPSARKSKPKAQGFTDEEVESWCIICCANATVTCFGCDKDLYCWGCWREGHVGEDAGLEEKSHVWERLMKPRKS